MKVCFFGSYLPEYSRNKILIDGLQKNDVKVYHCRSTKNNFASRYLELIRQFWRIKDDVDVIFVAFVGQLDVPLAWLLARLTNKIIAFDMFYSMYDTYVFDRQSALPGSLKAFTYWWIDKIAATLADKIITDTNAHASYFQKLFKLSPQKFHRVFVGGDDTVFKPQKKSKRNSPIRVEFHGMFTKLQGAEYFIEAAKLLEHNKNIEFWLIGGSKIYSEPIKLVNKLKLKNLRYFPRMSIGKLAWVLSQCNISVGHLGVTAKAQNVISNKTYQAMMVNNALIVGDTPANKELFKNKENALLVQSGDSKDLAKKILILVENYNLRKYIAKNAYELSSNLLKNKILGSQLMSSLK